MAKRKYNTTAREARMPRSSKHAEPGPRPRGQDEYLNRRIQEEEAKVIKPGQDVPPSSIDEVLGERNRVSEGIRRMKAQIEERLAAGKTTRAMIEQSNKTLTIDMLELATYQELKTLAVMYQKLTESEGMTIYRLLGEIPSTFNAQPIEVKAVLTKLFAELLDWRIASMEGLPQ